MLVPVGTDPPIELPLPGGLAVHAFDGCGVEPACPAPVTVDLDDDVLPAQVTLRLWAFPA